MRIVYLGTPDFAVLPLKALFNSGKVEIVGVVCNKDKPVGRKQVLTPPPVKVYAESVGIPVFQYTKIRAEGVEDLKKLNPDVMITCAFGQILSQEILDIPKYKTYNIHASLLPKYRGASPINYAILNGERKTGITIMRTDAGIDTGDILLSKSIDIKENETAGELFERLSVLGAECIIKALPEILGGNPKLYSQKEEDASYSRIIKKEDAKIDFSDTAVNIVNKIRAFNPSPVAYCFYNGEPFKIYSAKALEGNFNVGEVCCSQSELIVGTGKGLVSFLKVQKAGGKPMDIKDFLRGNKIPEGFKFN